VNLWNIIIDVLPLQFISQGRCNWEPSLHLSGTPEFYLYSYILH